MKADFSAFENRVEQNLPLAPKTTWRIGGSAEYYLCLNNKQELACLLDMVKAHGLPLFILGSGSNLLIDDTGLPGLTISLSGDFTKIKWSESGVTVGAGKLMPRLAKEMAAKGTAGFEHLIGIPGTVGAGIAINAGKGSDSRMDMRRILKTVTFMDANLNLVEASMESLELGYRSSRLRKERALITEATFTSSSQDDPEGIRQRMISILSERKAKFPLHLPNCGSVFKKPHESPPAGWLIETAGLKGCRIGDAQVSSLHANFIVNLGHASSSDVKALIDKVIRIVQKVHGIILEREVIFWPEENLWNRW
jgi:UDP-N-acetylmuramate dehydrogenase